MTFTNADVVLVQTVTSVRIPLKSQLTTVGTSNLRLWLGVVRYAKWMASLRLFLTCAHYLQFMYSTSYISDDDLGIMDM